MAESERNPALPQKLPSPSLEKGVSAERIREQASQTLQNTAIAFFIFVAVFAAVIVAVALLIVLVVF